MFKNMYVIEVSNATETCFSNGEGDLQNKAHN